jgi:HD-GYP domain-containing protein (c-di-GMP phosphodiesterase class II)
MDPFEEQLHNERQQRIENGPSARETATCLLAAALLALSCVGIGSIEPIAEPHWLTLTGLIVVFAAFWQIEFEVGPACTTPAQIVFVAMWFVVSPAVLPLAVVAGQLLGAALRAAAARDHTQLRGSLLNGTFAWFAVGPAVVLAAFGMPELSLRHLPIYALALLAQFATDTVASWLRFSATRGSRPPLRLLAWMFMVDAALAPIGLLLALALTQTPWAILSILPLGIVLSQFAKERDERIHHALELSSAYRGTAQLMGDVLEADDAYTGGEHTRGVVEMALTLGRAIKLSPRELRDLEFGALLHDIGKLRVPNEIINKPGKLTDEEWAVIKLHPGHGQEMLDRVGGELSRAGVIVRAHHERWDGGGYPDGLQGDEIPIEARIITICDSFSAMTTNRSYRKGMSRSEALAELARCAGTQFDPTLVDVISSAFGASAPAVPHLEVVQQPALSPAARPKRESRAA